MTKFYDLGSLSARLVWRGRWRRWLAQIIRLKHDPTPLIALGLILLLAYLVLGPLLAILTTGLQMQFRDSARADIEAGTWTWHYAERVFGSRISQVMFWDPLWRTLTISTAILTGSTLIGFGLAWILVRTDFPWRERVSQLMVVPYITPAWTFALAWTTLFKNRRVAGPPGIAEGLGFSPPDWLAYGPIPIIITLIFSLFPLAFLLFGSALQSVDTQLEESAQMVGASRPVILRRILLPLLLPALMSSGLLILSRTLGSFGTPYLLGSPVRYTVLATSLYGAIQRGEQGVASILTMVIILLGITVVGLDVYVIKEARRFVTISGKGSGQSLSPLRHWRIPAMLFVYGVLFIALVLPVGTLVLSTLTRRPGFFRWEDLTLVYWIGQSVPGFTGESGVLRNPAILRAAWNSLSISTMVAVLAGGLGTFIGYVAVRYGQSKVALYLRQLSFLPYLVPSIGFGAAYLTLFAVRRGPIPALYGTIWLVVLAMSINYLPFAARAGTAAMMQLGLEPEEAAMVSGAPWWTRFRRIVIPILKRTLITGIILPFISAMKELVLVVFLTTPGLELLTTQTLRYIDYGFTQLANGVVVIIIVIISILVLMLQWITGSGLTSSLRGN